MPATTDVTMDPGIIHLLHSSRLQMVTPASSQCWKQAERCRTRCYLIKTIQFAGYSDIEFGVGRVGITQQRDRRSSVRQTATKSKARAQRIYCRPAVTRKF